MPVTRSMSDNNDNDGSMTPEQALASIKAAAVEGCIRLASDELTAQYNEEIQRIYATISQALHGKPPRRPIWTADGQDIGVVLTWDQDTKDYTPDSYQALKVASQTLGVTLTPRTIWEDAAASLRSLSPSIQKS